MRFDVPALRLCLLLLALSATNCAPERAEQPTSPVRVNLLEHISPLPAESGVVLDREGDRVLLPPGSRLEALLSAPRDGVLIFDALRGKSGDELVVEVRTDDDQVTLRARPPASDLRFDLTELELGENGVALAIAFARPPADGDGGDVVVVAPRVEGTAASAPEQSSVLVASELDQMPSVFIYMVDTLRFDSLGAYNLDVSTPAFDRFARESIRVELAYAQSPWTRPSVASVLTGLETFRHGAVLKDSALAEHHVTLSERLRDQGYFTFAVSGSTQISELFGFRQGFDRFEELFAGSFYLDESSRLANEALDELLVSAERPMFGYIHTIDPHAPYDPVLSAEEEQELLATQPPIDGPARRRLDQWVQRLAERGSPGAGDEIGSTPWMIGLERGWLPSDARSRATLRQLYELEVAENDRQLGAFLDRLEAEDLYDESLIIVLSDHGEEFEEHGSWQHGKTFYDEVLRIPLLIRLPGGRDGGSTRPWGRQIDVLPTVLDVLGLAPDPALPGRSLARPGLTSTRLLAGLSLAPYEGESIVMLPWKLVRMRKPSASLELYALDLDPLEQRNLFGERPVTAAFLQRELDVRAQGGNVAPAVTIDADTQRRLEGMGYLN